jgi:hypothetical protein
MTKIKAECCFSSSVDKNELPAKSYATATCQRVLAGTGERQQQVQISNLSVPAAVFATIAPEIINKRRVGT